MELFDLLLQGFSIALDPLNLGLVILGCALGLFIGAMPGLGSVNGVAILLPPIKDAVAAVTSARSPSPANAMGLPSKVVATAVEAPGIPSMMELMAPPYMAP